MAKKIFKIFISLFILSIQINELLAQDFVREPSTTRYIKDIYQYVQEKISRNQYYLNEFKMNTANLPWVNNKPFQSTQQYHYSFVGDNSAVLRLVIVITKVAEKNYYTEYLYENSGKLVFCFEKQNDTETHSYRELSAYFENNLCINLLIDKEIIDAKKGLGNHATKIKKLFESGKFYAERFQTDMQVMKDEK